jgi:hypothetical protein
MESNDDRHILGMKEHVERWIGPVAHVFHVPGPMLIHSDVLHVPPTRRRPRHTLVTCGMGLKPMCPPIQAKECRYGELFLSLPGSWPVEPGRPTPSAPWIGALGELARLPHLEEGWLWYGHTVGMEDPGEPIFPGCPFTAWILGPPMSLDPDACLARIDGREVQLFSAIPIYREEMELAIARGAGRLFRLLSALEVDDEVTMDRRKALTSPVRRRRR